MVNDGRDKNKPAHYVERSNDARVDGPYLDDIRADQERAYRDGRLRKSIETGEKKEAKQRPNNNTVDKAVAKKSAAKKTAAKKTVTKKATAKKAAGKKS